jgi:hypothetical protein
MKYGERGGKEGERGGKIQNSKFLQIYRVPENIGYPIRLGIALCTIPTWSTLQMSQKCVFPLFL